MRRPWFRISWRRFLPQLLVALMILMSILGLRSYISGSSAPIGALTSHRSCTQHQLQGMEDIGSFWAGNCVLEFPETSSPVTSVIMLMHNRVAETFLALRSITTQVTQAPFEVILVDDASTDDTPKLISRIRGARSKRFEKSMRYARANNYAVFNMSSDAAEFILLLNNDIEMLTPRTYTSLVDLLTSQPEAGAAGCKIVLLDGKLQEAGSLVWGDGSAFGYGRGEDPNHPRYNYVRTVDYCSGACLMVRRDIYRRLGGFDVERFPMYYEDTDLQLKIRYEEQRTVLYQPGAVIRHHEYGSSSRSEAIKMMQAAHKVFQGRWKQQLRASHFPHGDRYLPCAANHAEGLRFLWVDYAIPDDAHSSRWMRTVSIIDVLRSQGHFVTIYPLVDKRRPAYADVMGQHGIEIGCPDINIRGEAAQKQAFSRFLLERAGHFDAVILGDATAFTVALPAVLSSMPNGFIIGNAEALSWHRGESTDLTLSPREVDQLSKCRLVWLASARDLSPLQGLLATKSELRLIQYPVTAGKLGARPYIERRTLGFYADFDSADAKSDAAALSWFLRQVWPIITRDLRDLRFVIGHRGSKAPREVATLVEAVKHAEVRDGVTLDAFYSEVRLHVLPHSAGEWVPVRLLEALSRGVPSVAQQRWVAALGINGEDYGVLGVDGAEDMADTVMRVWADELLWTKLRESAHVETPRRFSAPAFEEAVLGASIAVPRVTCRH